MFDFKDVEIIRVPSLKNPNGSHSKTPARCNRLTKKIWINEQYFNHLEPTHRLFVLLHELGHIYHNTPNEILADDFASKEFLKLGYPLSESIKSLSRVLTGTNDEHIERIESQIERAKKIDLQNNKIFKQMTLVHTANDFDNYDEIDNYTEDLFGIGKARKAKKEAKTNIKNAKADAIRMKAQAILESAKSGVPLESKGMAIFNKVADTATNIFGKKTQDATFAETPTGAMQTYTPPPAEKTFMQKYGIWIGVGSAVLIGVVVLILKRK